MAFASRARSFTSRALSFLGSLRLAAVLLILIAIAAIVGGIVPQSPITPSAEAIYESYGLFWQRVITRLALDDVFHSWWFLALTGLFALNLIVCTGRRTMSSVIRALGRPVYAEIAEGEATRIDLPSKAGDPIARAEAVLRHLGYRNLARVQAREPDDGATQLVARRFRLGALGADLVHLGILVILAGALLGALRQEGTFVVNDWERGLRLSACDDESASDCVPLPYDVRVDDFGAETYEGSGRIKSYWADLSFWRAGTLEHSGRTEVNRPLSIDGVGFYPWRYGQDPSAARIRLHIVERDRNAVISEIPLGIGETAAVPGTTLHVTALRFFQTFALDDAGNAVDLGNTPGGHSAALLQIDGASESGDGASYRDLALPFLAETSSQPEYAFLLADATVPAFLQIHFVRSPGYRVVWWGFVLVMIGLAGALYFAPSTIRLEVRATQMLIRAESRRARHQLEAIAEAIRLDLSEPEPEPELKTKGGD